MYALGKGVPKDYSEAVKWYKLAANQGHAIAQYKMGISYDMGHGIPQNYKEAMKWYELAANQKVPQAQYNLGLMYGDGDGVPKNYILAFMWINLAASKGIEAAIKVQTKLEERMTNKQLAKAQRLAREWKPKEE